MKNAKIMATIPMVASLIMPITTFAATSYETSTNDVKYTSGEDIKYDSNENQVKVTATQGSTYSVRVPKTIVLDGVANGVNASDYEVSASGNLASDEIITIKPESSHFVLKDTRKVKADVEGTINQKVVHFVDTQAKNVLYKDDETTIELGKTTGNISVEGLTSGSWEGTFNFVISLTTNTK